MPETPWREAWSQHSISRRVALLVGFGAIVPMLLVAWGAAASLGDLTSTLFAERRERVLGLAREVELHLDAALERLALASSAAHFDPEDGDPAPEHEALRRARVRTRYLEAAFLVARDGRLLAVEPDREAAWRERLEARPELGAALRSGRPAVHALPAGAGDGAALLLVPYRDVRGQVAGVVGGVVASAERLGGELLPARPIGPEAAVELVDAGGRTIAAAGSPVPEDASGRHGQRMLALVARREPLVEAHGESGGSGERREVVAVAPLARWPWSVVLREPEAAVLGPVAELRGRLLLLAPVVLAVALVFAWGAARSVVTPLEVLNQAARRIAEGRVGEPIRALGSDEVGRLGSSLETMRRALEASLAELQRANEELEARVDARTRELRELYGQLQQQDAGRRRLLRKVIAAQEDERKRLARELHDETCQTLAALALRLDTARGALSTPGAADRLREARELATRTLDEIHRLIFALRPSVLDDLGLLPAIRWYAAHHVEPAGVSVRCELEDPGVALPTETETAVFRAVQEALSNVMRHSGAETVLVELRREGDWLEVAIEDDGRGFEPQAFSRAGESGQGLGLMGMRERMELLGGEARIDSAPDSGTRVLLRVPLAGPLAGEEPKGGADPGPDR